MTKHLIGKWGILLASIGGIIGSGWLFGPFYVAQMAGPAALISWIIGGFLMMLIALTFAELAAMLPIVGGIARFSHFSHGTFVSFTMSWCGWISSIVVAPIETMALIQYASTYFPSLTMKVGTISELSALGIFLAALLMLMMCCLNFWGIRFVTKANSSIVAFKITVPIFTALVLIYLHPRFSNLTQTPFAPYGLKGILEALPAAGVIFSFIGYSPAILLAGESKNPQKTIPFAIIGSLLFCIALYTLVQFAFLLALDSSALADGWSKIHFKGDSGPFAGISMNLGLVWLAILLYIDAAISPFGTALIYTAATARMNIAMSQNGYMPEWMQKLHTKHKSPLFAIGINYILGLLLFLPFPGWQEMVSFLISAFIFSYAVGPVSFFALRKILPDAERPFKLPYEKFFGLSAFYVCNLLSFWVGFNTLSKILITIVIGWGFLLSYKFFNKKKGLKLNMREGLWLFPYYVGLGLLSYFGTFGGGKGLIGFGWDFVVLLLFSCLIFYLAQKSKIRVSEPTEKKTGVLPTI